ncbi:putative vacuolar proton translocating ATPase subunit A [Cryptosporidium serpentis]
MGVLRSELMSHGTLVLPNDRAREFIDILGREVNIQFVDMNAVTMNRQYRKYIQRIDEMERILRVLFTEIEKLPEAVVHKGNYETFLDHDHLYQLDKVEESLQSLYGQFINFRDNNSSLIQQKNAAVEECAVAKAATISFAPSRFVEDHGNFLLSNAVERGDGVGLSKPFMNSHSKHGSIGDMMFSNIAGVVRQDDQERFARTLFRATRGNTFTHFQQITEDIPDSATGKLIPKVVFVVYFQGATTSAVYDKISRICDAFGVCIYPWPASYEYAIQRVDELNILIQDKEKALQAYEQYICDEIETLLQPVTTYGNSLIEEWRLFCIKEKSIYATLNLFEGSDITLRSDCWYPLEEEEKIRRILIAESSNQHVGAFLLSSATSISDHGFPAHHGGPHDGENTLFNTPPTYIKTNEFTVAFQDFVNAYGVPRYQEVNPALFTIVSFPFLFGVMYGDVGHGFIVLLFGLYLLYAYQRLKKENNEILNMLLNGRYMITLMGFFATYCGLLYNDFFSLGLNLFGSRFIQSNQTTVDGSHIYIPNSSQKTSYPYPFGFDPAWKGASNEMIVMNSFKMKFSVIVAFVQMSLGVILKGINSLHFGNYLDFFCEFIPQILFMTGFVGYLNFLIFYKWLTPVIGYNKPSILNTLIGLQGSLFGAEIQPQDIFYPNQATVQKFITLVLLISIPWMFFPKPIYLIYKARKQKKIETAKINYSSRSSQNTVLSNISSHSERKSSHMRRQSSDSKADYETIEHNSEHDPTEIFIHQLIETVEFLIGSISNTASYLRLWALSLAHNMLALVFFENSLLVALLASGLAKKSILLFLTFIGFASATFGVMICMDSLECFLHGLRLQWVEFQNKFFKGDGILFAPFNHLRIILATEEALNNP